MEYQGLFIFIFEREGDYPMTPAMSEARGGVKNCLNHITRLTKHTVYNIIKKSNCHTYRIITETSGIYG